MSTPPFKVQTINQDTIPSKFTLKNQYVYWAFLQGISEGFPTGVWVLIPKRQHWKFFTC